MCTHLTVHPFMSVFVSRRLYVFEGVSIFARCCLACICASPLVSMCVSSPVAASSGPHNPQERVVSFFTVTGSGPRRVAPGLQTNSVWPESLFFFAFASTDHRPRSLQEPRQRNGLGRDSVCLRQTEEDHTPSWVRKRPRQRDRHAKTKFNWFTAYMDQGLAHLFTSMSWFNQRAL